MFKRSKPAESFFDRLEREANDEFRMLEDLGPAHFGMEHLLELRQRMMERIARFERLQRLAMAIGGCAAGWIFLGVLTGWAGYPWVALAFFGIGSLSLGLFLVMIFRQYRRFRTKGEMEYTRRMIEEELRARTGPMSQKPKRK